MSVLIQDMLLKIVLFEKDLMFKNSPFDDFFLQGFRCHMVNGSLLSNFAFSFITTADGYYGRGYGNGYYNSEFNLNHPTMSDCSLAFY